VNCNSNCNEKPRPWRVPPELDTHDGCSCGCADDQAPRGMETDERFDLSIAQLPRALIVRSCRWLLNCEIIAKPAQRRGADARPDIEEAI
jgi:hypothetical protein